MSNFFVVRQWFMLDWNLYSSSMCVAYWSFVSVILLVINVQCDDDGDVVHAGGAQSQLVCFGSQCMNNVVFFILLLAVIVGIANVIGFIVWHCWRQCLGKPRKSNSEFIADKSGKSENSDQELLDHFLSGFWLGKNFQDGRWHDAHLISLSFDPEMLTVTGAGTDNVGKFTIEGTYSFDTGRLAFTKTCQMGRGEGSENVGHQVTVQLAWNSAKEQFEGKWYLRTKKYRGEDKFELKFDKIRTLLTNPKMN